MNDDDMLGLVRDRMTRARDDLGSVHMEQPVSVVLHRAGSRRLRHRLYGAAAGTGALGVALAVGLGAVGTGGGATGGVADGSPSAGPSAAKTAPVTLDAWSVTRGANGAVELTIRQLADKAELEEALAAAGAPSVVNFGGFCKAANGSNPSGIGNVLGGTTSRGGIIIESAAIPSGDELSIGISYPPDGKASGGFGFMVGLVPRGTTLTCSNPVKFGGAK